MLHPIAAAAILGAFLLLFGFLVPYLNVKKRDLVSLRWCVVVAVLAMMLGAVIDFAELSDDARHILLVGGLAISGGFVLLRSVEKALAKGWLRGLRLDAKKGDASVSLHTDGGKHES